MNLKIQLVRIFFVTTEDVKLDVMTLRLKAAVGLAVLFLFACKPFTKKDLEGKWTAVQLTEKGDSLRVNLQEITLTFDNDGYAFTSTLNYRESGTYQLQNNLLITQDTIAPNAKEKAVEITALRNDSLFIRMNEGGDERVMVMTRRY